MSSLWRRMGRMKVQFHSFLTSVTDGGDWSSSCPHRFIHTRKDTMYSWIECWMGAGDSVDVSVEKIKSLACARIRSPDRPARSLNTLLTELPRLQMQTIENLRWNTS